MKISIIVPIYNAGKYLETCLESIINQTYTDYEVILINDGSVDKSLELCKLYERKNHRFSIVDKLNEGVSKSRNIGITKSTGDFVCFVDADDHIDPDYLESLIHESKKVDNVEMVFQGVRRIFKNSKENLTQIPDMVISAKDTYTLFNLGLISINGNPVSKLFKASIIKENNLFFNESFTYNEDMIFVLEYILLCSKNIVFSSVIHYNYMINQNSLTNRILSPNQYLDPYFHYKDLLFKNFKIDRNDKEYAIIYENFKTNLHMFMNAALIANYKPLDYFDKEDLEIYKEVSKASGFQRKFLDFFILRKIYFIPRIITRYFFRLKS